MRLVGVVMLVGCTAQVAGVEGPSADPKSDSGETSSGGTTTMTLSRYFDEIAEIHCMQAFSCRASFPPERGYPFEDEWGTSVRECVGLLIAAWNPAQVETEIAKGRITYDGAAAVSCLSGVAFAACPVYWQVGIDWAESCYHVVVGLVRAGGECENDYSCTSFVCNTTRHLCE